MRKVEVRHGIHRSQHGIKIILVIWGGGIINILRLMVDINVRDFTTCHQNIELEDFGPLDIRDVVKIVVTIISIGVVILGTSFSCITPSPDKIVTEIEYTVTTRVSDNQLYLFSQVNDEVIQSFQCIFCCIVRK